MRGPWGTMTAVGFEPTHPKIVELESTALDHSAKLSVTDSTIFNLSRTAPVLQILRGKFDRHPWLALYRLRTHPQTQGYKEACTHIDPLSFGGQID